MPLVTCPECGAEVRVTILSRNREKFSVPTRECVVYQNLLSERGSVSLKDFDCEHLDKAITAAI